MILGQDEPCLLGDEVSTMVPLKSGVNDVCVVNGTYVYKKFALPEHAWHEAIALRVLGTVCGSPPKVIGNSNQTIVMEFVKGTKEADGLLQDGEITVGQINVLVARYITDIYRAFQCEQSHDLCARSLSCEVRYRTLCTWWGSNKKALRKLFPSQVDILDAEWSHVLPALRKSLVHTFVHRDLHMSNLLIKPAELWYNMTVIDCEHALLGPLELEFLNSRFWNDQKSLDVDGVISILKESYFIPFNKDLERALMPFYIVDQLYCADRLNDKQKMHTVMAQMAHYCKKR